MSSTEYCIYGMLLIGVIGAVMGLLSHKADTNPGNIAYDAERRQGFENSMQNGEKLIAVCPASLMRDSYWAITDRRLLISGKNGLVEIPRSEIKKVKGLDHFGNRCKDPARMISLTVVANKKYTLANCSDTFVALASQLV